MKRAINMLGLCMRAGKLLSGERACIQAIRAKNALLVVLDASASANAQKAVKDACAWHNVPLIILAENELGIAIGKPGRMVAAITDPSFADRIQQLAGAGD